MKPIAAVIAASFVLFLTAPLRGAAQAPPSPAPSPASPAPPAAPATPAPPAAPAPPERAAAVYIPLKLLITISRYQGEQKLSSYPYEVYVLAGAGQTTLRVGTNVKLPHSGAPAVPLTVDGQNTWVGTQIDAAASPESSERYRIRLSIQDSSVYTPDEAGQADNLSGVRSYTLTTMLLLRDGQSMQFSVGTDKVSGDVMKADVTLTLLK